MSCVCIHQRRVGSMAFQHNPFMSREKPHTKTQSWRETIRAIFIPIHTCYQFTMWKKKNGAKECHKLFIWSFVFLVPRTSSHLKVVVLRESWTRTRIPNAELFPLFSHLVDQWSWVTQCYNIKWIYLATAV